MLDGSGWRRVQIPQWRHPIVERAGYDAIPLGDAFTLYARLPILFNEWQNGIDRYRSTSRWWHLLVALVGS